MELTARQIDLWHVLTDQPAAQRWCDAGGRLLSADEADARSGTRTRRRDGSSSSAGRCCGRRLPGTPATIPSRWSSATIAVASRRPAAVGHGVEFNLSHTRGLVVCAVAMGDAVGVDAESRDRPRSLAPLELARRFFAPAETAALARLPAEERLAAFLAFWTLKEAFVKACGTGLATPLKDFVFSLSAAAGPTISFASDLKERPEDWQFAQPGLAAGYHVALAVHRPAASPCEIVLRQGLV